MGASMKLCMSKISRNKKQNIMIALVIILSTLLLSTALAVLRNTGNAYLEKHADLNGSHEILELTEGIYNPDNISGWWDTQEGVTASNMLRYRNMTGFAHNGNDIGAYLYMTDAANYTGRVDKLLFANGAEQASPEKDSVWIPTSLAYKNNIALGDELAFQTDNGAFVLRVSGIVVDLPYCAPFSSNARVWMNIDDYEQYISLLPGNDSYMMAIRFDNYAESRSYWDAFEAFLGTPYLESVRNFESLSSFYMLINQMIGFVMIFLAVVMMVIAVSSIGFTISDDILSSYKTIGIIKSMGMTSFQSVGVYLLQYAFVAGISVAAGIAGGYFVSGTIVGSSLAYLKADNAPVSLRFGGVALGVFVGLMLIILLCVFAFSYKTRHIKPVQAIRFGASETAYSKSVSGIGGAVSFERLPVTLVIGLRAILRKFRSNILIVVISALTTSVLVFSLIFIGSFASIKDTIAMWGYDQSDLTVLTENMSDADYAGFKDSLSSDERVENFNLYSDIGAAVPAVRDTGISADSMSVNLSVIDGSYDDTGFANLEGRSPVTAGEISLGVNLAQKYGAEIGETFDIYIQGQRRGFVVTGIYQAISNMAYSGRVCAEAIREIDPGYSFKDIVFVNLRDGVSPAEYAAELNSRYGSAISASTSDELVSGVFSTAVALLITPLGIISVVFILISLVIIYCTCHIGVKKEMRTYGIYKSVGMRSGDIRRSISAGVLILEIIGALPGVAIGIGLLPKLLNMVLSNYGLVRMPMAVNYAGIVIAVAAGVLISSLGARFASKRIRDTSPRILTVE